jgi:hypothetical protein
MTVRNSLFSRNHDCQPGHDFQDGIDLPEWEEQSVWGYDMGSFFAQLWANDSTTETPERPLHGPCYVGEIG